jgi:hypothetical protein
MRTIIPLLIMVCVVAGCRSKRHLAEESPFRSGFGFAAWGVSSSEVDSLVARDTLWRKVTSVDNSTTQGKIIVVQDKRREYYLEFDSNDRFFMMSYISDTGDAEHIQRVLKQYYGEPDRSKKENENYQEQIWNVEADSVHLEIQMLITRRDYALKVLNKKIK